MVPRKKRFGLTGEDIRNASLIAALVGSLYQGWQANTKAAEASAEAQGARQYAGAVGRVSARRAVKIDSLKIRVAGLERRVRFLERKARRVSDEVELYGPEPAPEGYKPESHGILWYLKHPFGR